MDRKWKLWEVTLDLFDGAAAAGAGEAGGATGETGAGSAAGRSKEGETKVLYGKQSAEKTGTGKEVSGPPGERKQSGKEGEEASAEERDRRRRYRELVNGEMKELFAKDVQKIINRRFAQTKELEERLGQSQPILDMLMDRYGIQNGDAGALRRALETDDAYWAQAAAKEGMSVESYQRMKRLERNNRALLEERGQRREREVTDRWIQGWVDQAAAMRDQYPHFDLRAEMQNRQFMSMLRSGVPVRHAYEVLHMDDIKAAVAKSAAAWTEKQVVNGIRAKGARPAENGTAAQSAFTVKDDVSKLTRKDRAEIARRVARGESITF